MKAYCNNKKRKYQSLRNTLVEKALLSVGLVALTLGLGACSATNDISSGNGSGTGGQATPLPTVSSSSGYYSNSSNNNDNYPTIGPAFTPTASWRRNGGAQGSNQGGTLTVGTGYYSGPGANNAAPVHHAGPASLYPNPTLTPGDVFPGVTAQEVCVSGYSKSVRSVSTAEKAAVYQSYGIVNTPGQHEVDHLISLELGGSNNVKNLWPEPYDPRPGAHEKDEVENALHAEVCAQRMSLGQAQQIISQDWYAYYLQLHHQ